MILRKAHKLTVTDHIVIMKKKYGIKIVEQHNDMVYVTTLLVGFNDVVGDTIAFYSDDMVEVE